MHRLNTIVLVLLVLTPLLPGCGRRATPLPATASPRAEASPEALASVETPTPAATASDLGEGIGWYEWERATFSLAQADNKPILLDLTAVWCHWCHVMDETTYGDPEVIRLVNTQYIPIRVDTDQRPDVQARYLLGGWPTTAFLTAQGDVLASRTYVPPKEMISLLQEISDYYAANEADIATRVAESRQQQAASRPQTALGVSSDIIQSALERMRIDYDPAYGGFGQQAKFPTPGAVTLIFRHDYAADDEAWRERALHTLAGVQRLVDPVWGGVYRYSVSPDWQTPHHEKMLADNAEVLRNFLEAYQATGDDRYRQTAREILTYILRDMTSPKGGFYSAEDADVDGEEGKYYVWTEKEILNILGEKEANFAAHVFNIDAAGNFKDEASGRATGNNILYIDKSIDKIAAELKLTENDVRARIEEVRVKLFQARVGRPRPYKDDKILTSWNGLMIAALAKAGRAFGEDEYVQAAKQAVDFILQNVSGSDGRLLHRFCDGDAAITGYLNDYAFFTWGLIELYEATFDVRYLKDAIKFNDLMIEHFRDDSHGGFFFTADDGEELLVRRKELSDGAIPSGNSVAMSNLIKLGRLTTDPKLETEASNISAVFSEEVKRVPLGYTHFLSGVDFAIGPAFELIVVGELDSDETASMLKAIRTRFIPNKVVIFRPVETKSAEILSLAKYAEPMESIDGKPTAYICENYNCKLPTTNINQMLELLNVNIVNEQETQTE